MSERTALPVRAIVEVSRGSFIKRELHAGRRVDFLSPVPCPFNYGYLPEVSGEDGDPVDAVVLGERLAVGEEVHLPVVALVRFLDAGCVDDKWVLAAEAPGGGQLRRLRRFFRVYSVARRLLNLLSGKRGETRFVGLEIPGEDGLTGPQGYDRRA